jgi:hypothetical protein
MPDDPKELREECRAFARYLIEREPSAHVLDKYVRAHELGVVPPPGGPTARDLALVSWARRSALLARAADIHARFFAPRGLLRRKLVLLVGIIETDPEGRRAADTAGGGSFIGTFVRLAWWGTESAALLLLGLPLFLLARGRS